MSGMSCDRGRSHASHVSCYLCKCANEARLWGVQHPRVRHGLAGFLKALKYTTTMKGAVTTNGKTEKFSLAPRSAERLPTSSPIWRLRRAAWARHPGRMRAVVSRDRWEPLGSPRAAELRWRHRNGCPILGSRPGAAEIGAPSHRLQHPRGTAVLPTPPRPANTIGRAVVIAPGQKCRRRRAVP